MSEFKFACPVCGQHITTDSGSSGKQIVCPTCFRKMVVPQAPTAGDTKLILSASQVAGPRPGAAWAAGELGPRRPAPALRTIATMAVLLALLCAAGAAAWVRWGKLLLAETPPPATPGAPKRAYPIPADIKWTLDLTEAVFPATVAAGSIRGCGFRCERATLQGGHLTLRQGGLSGAPLMGVSVYLFARQGEELSGKSVQIPPDRAPPRPRVTLRWPDEQLQAKKNDIEGGYALKLAFSQAANGRLPGRIYLCLPDASRSFVAGTFDAEIKKAAPPKPPPAKTPKP